MKYLFFLILIIPSLTFSQLKGKDPEFKKVTVTVTRKNCIEVKFYLGDSIPVKPYSLKLSDPKISPRYRNVTITIPYETLEPHAVYTAMIDLTTYKN